MTYRQRRERRAEQLRTGAERRAQEAARLHALNEPYRGDIAFATQPGHIPERARAIARSERAYRLTVDADARAGRAAEIERQMDRAIYSDDPDAAERLRERIAALEAQRERYKSINREIRKGPGWAERLALTPEERAELDGNARYSGTIGIPAYALRNLGADIRRNRERLATIERAAAGVRPLRVTRARFAGACERCGGTIEPDAWIGKYPDGWSHVADAGGSWVRCEAAGS